MIDFIKEVTWNEADKFMKVLDKRKINYGMITEWGATVPDDAEFIIELGEKDYIATKGFLQTSDDGVFIMLMKDGKKKCMPDFSNIFEIIEISKNHKGIRIKEKNQC